MFYLAFFKESTKLSQTNSHLNMKKTFFFGLLAALLTLTACVLPEKEDPFERLPEENLEVIEGKLFPFSVSVSTRATHRLERDSKLVGYLASDLVQLAEFEGQDVILEGVWRNEKMRQIFWVEGIKIPSLMADAEDEEEKGPQRFTTKKFTMLIPPTWEYSLAPNGVVYFLNKEDPARRVFLTFSVEDYSPESGIDNPNISMNGFTGMKSTTTDENGKEREVITLYSNLGPKKYVYTATYFFDDFDTKKAVFDVLQSFVEGEAAVQEVVINEQKAKAEAEAEKLALSKSEKQENETEEDSNETVEDSSEEADKGVEVPVSAPVVATNSSYTNLIDDRAYSYDSNLGFSLKIPFGNWYRNFGAYDGSLSAIGVAKNVVNTAADVQIWVKVLAKDKPSAETTELITGKGITLIKKRNDSSVYELTGPVSQRDALWSITDSIQ